MGVTYEMYKPMTDALQSITLILMPREDIFTYEAKELNAAVENDNTPQMAESVITNHTAFTGVWDLRLMRFHHFEPGRALSRENAKMTREASTACEHPQRYCPGSN